MILLTNPQFCFSSSGTAISVDVRRGSKRKNSQQKKQAPRPLAVHLHLMMVTLYSHPNQRDKAAKSRNKDSTNDQSATVNDLPSVQHLPDPNTAARAQGDNVLKEEALKLPESK